MGAMKELMMEMGNAGTIPADAAMLRRLRKVGGPIKTVAVEVEVRGVKGRERGIPADEARRLAADERISAEDRESIRWSMEVCGITPAGCCPKCGGDSIRYMVDASFIGGHLTIDNADEPEGPTFRGLSHCEDCDSLVPVAAPAWTAKRRHDALAAFCGPRLRDALAALYRAAVEAGVSGAAVDEAARRLRGCGVEPHDPLAGYKERTAERTRRLDALEQRCAWGNSSAASLDYRVREAREQWQRIMDEQGADEVANGL